MIFSIHIFLIFYINFAAIILPRSVNSIHFIVFLFDANLINPNSFNFLKLSLMAGFLVMIFFFFNLFSISSTFSNGIFYLLTDLKFEVMIYQILAHILLEFEPIQIYQIDVLTSRINFVYCHLL